MQIECIAVLRLLNAILIATPAWTQHPLKILTLCEKEKKAFNRKNFIVDGKFQNI